MAPARQTSTQRGRLLDSRDVRRETTTTSEWKDSHDRGIDHGVSGGRGEFIHGVLDRYPACSAKRAILVHWDKSVRGTHFVAKAGLRGCNRIAVDAVDGEGTDPFEVRVNGWPIVK